MGIGHGEKPEMNGQLVKSALDQNQETKPFEINAPDENTLEVE